MSTNKNQSAIKEARDQLFLDFADGGRLTIVSDNLGMNRPAFGIGDDEWRALVKNIALDYKQIHKAFRKVIEICVGPKFNRPANLASPASVGDLIVTVNDASNLIQIGTLVFDGGQATEETVDYCYVDYASNQVFLVSALTFDHAVYADQTDLLQNSILAGAQSIVINDTEGLPTSFPYTLSLGTGTIDEEYVTVTAMATTSANTTFSQVWSNDGGATWTDETADANNATDADWNIFDTGAAADVSYFGYEAKFGKITFDNANGTAGTVGTVTWEYWNGTTWSALSGVTDGTSGFTAAVSDGQELTFTIPSDWAPTIVNGSSSLYFVRADVGTAFTVAPVYDQGFIETVAGTLTISPTTSAHSGFSTGFVRKPLETAASVGQTFILLDLTETADFPATGWVRIDANTANEEIVYYDENDYDNNVLYLKTPLQFAHVVGVSVELMVPGVSVDVANVLQEGIHWDIFDTDPKNLRIYIPDDITTLYIRDASWLHALVPGATATTLSANVSIGDTVLPVTSVLGFPEQAGILDINSGGETVFYTSKTSGQPVELSASSEPFTLVDGQTLTVSVDGAAAATATFNTLDFVDISNATALEVAAVINTDVANQFADVIDGKVRITSDAAPGSSASIEVTGGTANPELGFEEPSFIITQGLLNAFVSTDSVDLIRVPYGSTDLEDGNPRDLAGQPVDNQFPGPYIYDSLTRGPGRLTVGLNEVTPSATRIITNQFNGWTNFEVEDASLFLTSPFTPYNIKIGRGSGFEEDALLTDVSLAVDTSTTTNAPLSPLDTIVSVVSSVDFPETIVTNKAGYRIIISEGRPEEEIVKVLDNDPGANDLTTDPIVNSHVSGATVRLLNDTLTVDILQNSHAGSSISPTVQGHLVEKLISTLDMDTNLTAAGFPQNGYIYINFCGERISTRSKINSIISTTVYQLDDTSSFPTTDFPYQVTLGEGTTTEEFVNVIANDTGLNRLTFSAPPAYAHSSGNPALATGSITTVAVASLVDGEIVEINDGNLLYIFEFDVAGDGVTAGNIQVDVSGDTTADDVRDTLINAINGTAILITASNGGAATVSLTHDNATHLADIAIFENVANGGFAVSGMSGGDGINGEYVSFSTTSTELVEYQDTDGTAIEFIPPITLGKHTIGETVNLAPLQSIPTLTGSDYPFYLPPDPLICLKLLFEEIRAYGVTVTLINTR